MRSTRARLLLSATTTSSRPPNHLSRLPLKVPRASQSSLAGQKPRTATRALTESAVLGQPLATHSSSSTAQQHETPTPLTHYHTLVESGTLRQDDHQTRIIRKLHHLHEQVVSYRPPPLPNATPPVPASLFSRFFQAAAPPSDLPAPPENMPRGLYLYGDVGTGKTMLMDLFYNTLPPSITRKRRIHFHAFMVDVHKRVHEAKIALGLEGGDPIAPVARALAEEAYILCFDEFQVTDVADAMILRRLFESLSSYGVIFVITSNRHPNELYKNGIQRESFIPCIQLLNTRLDVTDLDSGTDYRRIPRALSHVYHSPLDGNTRREMRKLFHALAGDKLEQGRTLNSWGRAITIPESSPEGVAWFEFADLCGSKSPMSAADYLEITRTFPTIFVTEVPKMNLSSKDMARRFITFIDACYESKTKLLVSSEVPIFQIFSDENTKDKNNISDHMRSVMDDLGLSVDAVGTSSMFTGDEEIFAFARCCSRLVEMGSKQWAERAGSH